MAFVAPEASFADRTKAIESIHIPQWCPAACAPHFEKGRLRQQRPYRVLTFQAVAGLTSGINGEENSKSGV